MSKVLVKFDEYMSRSSNLEGLFISTEEKVNEMMGKEVYLGEVAGKHSEVIVTLGSDDIEIISDDANVIQVLSDIFPSGTISGINPFKTYDERDVFDHD